MQTLLNIVQFVGIAFGALCYIALFYVIVKYLYEKRREQKGIVPWSQYYKNGMPKRTKSITG